MKRGQAASISWALHFGAAAQEEDEEEEEGRHRQRQASPVDSNPNQTLHTASNASGSHYSLIALCAVVLG